MREISDIINKLKQREPLSEKEHAQIITYLSDEGSDVDAKQVLASHWNEVCDDKSLELEQPDDLFYKIYYKTQREEVTRGKLRIGNWIQRIAAVLLLPILIVSAWYYMSNSSASSKVVSNTVLIESPSHSKTRFFLPDGTQGWLHASSKIQYEVGNANNRIVRLEGEAYFDVAKREKQAFIVNTNDFKVRVLGTRFNVIADNTSPLSKVYLEEGSVEMLDVDSESQVVLQPGQEYVFNRLNKQYVVNSEVEYDHLAWTKGILLLENKSLKDAAIELQKFYDVDIEIIDKELEELSVYAKIQHERLEEVLEYTKLILPITYQISKPVALKDGGFTKRKVVIRKVK